MFGLSIKINEKQLNGLKNFFNNFELNLKKQIANDTEKAAIKMTQNARANAHVITGNMRNSINYKKSGESSYTVSADIEYAVYENARGGEHAFFDNAVKDLESEFYDTVQQGVKAVISKRGPS